MKPAFPYDKKTETIHLPDELSAELKSILEAGNKPAALKRVMELTGAGLAISKKYLDALPGRQFIRKSITNSYTEPVSKLLGLGFPEEPWLDYLALGLTLADIPELIRLVEDRDLRFTEPPADLAEGEELLEWYAQIHAWRALAQFKAEAAISAILGILYQIDDEDDDWIGEDAQEVFAAIGPAAIQPVGEYLVDEEHGLYARTAAASSLRNIALTHPGTRAACLSPLVTVLEKYKENDEGLNSFLIFDLVQLKAIEHIDLIEKAFAEEQVDEIIMGDFEDVQIELGLREKRSRPHAPFSPFNYAPSLESMFLAEEKSKNDKKKEKEKRKQEKKSRKKNRKKK